MTTTALDRYRTVTAAGTEIHVDRFGWPVETCGRCGGSGEYSYNAMDGTKCYGCGGRGVILAGGIPRAEYVKAVDAQRSKIGCLLVRGDEVRRWGSPKGTPFRQVVTVTDTGDVCSRARTGDEPEIVHSFQLVTFDDDETVHVGGESWTGKVTVNRAPYVEASLAAYVTKIKRREAAAARRAARPPKAPKPRPAKANKFAGKCTACQADVPAGAGTWSSADGVRHTEGTCPS